MFALSGKQNFAKFKNKNKKIKNVKTIFFNQRTYGEEIELLSCFLCVRPLMRKLFELWHGGWTYSYVDRITI